MEEAILRSVLVPAGVSERSILVLLPRRIKLTSALASVKLTNDHRPPANVELKNTILVS